MNHRHCDKCYDAHCPGVARRSDSCLVIRCPQNCGAVLHACKGEEHRLLCPNETAPCLNALYGCPLRLQRRRLAKHLEVCPASVVCCSQDWNRWPVSEGDLAFYRKLSENPQTSESLDVAAAVRDQELLFRSIKMKTVFPELIKEDPAPRAPPAEINSRAEEADCSSVRGDLTDDVCARLGVEGPTREEREPPARSRDGRSSQKHSSREDTRTKERVGGEQAVGNFNTKERGEEEGASSCQSEAPKFPPTRESPAAAQSFDGTTGLAPWQDGVLERLRKEANVAEYNMYVAHNGAMLINFGQLAACTPRERDFVYGSLEPVEVETVRTFKVPTSYRAKRHHLRNGARDAPPRHRGVDAADLGEAAGEGPGADVAGAALLCSLEREARGRSISESVPVDGLYVDTATQTYAFAGAPFAADASLADAVAGEPALLRLSVQAESVTRRHNRTNSAFSRTCGLFFRRDEYGWHFRNAHADLRSSLCGWFQQRCPLAYLGCTFAQIRFRPAGQRASIQFRRGPGAFVLRPEVPEALGEGGGAAGDCGRDPLSSLPPEILRQIVARLDSFALSQLSLVSHLMRAVCATLLQERGMVSLKWEREAPSHGRCSWKCQTKVWEFSSLFSPVNRWSFGNIPPMSDHLKSCLFYQREERTEPVALACLGELRHKYAGVEHK